MAHFLTLSAFLGSTNISESDPGPDWMLIFTFPQTDSDEARLVKRTAEECHVPFRTLATDTKPRRRLVAAMECLLHGLHSS
jgi:hypothetical protein